MLRSIAKSAQDIMVRWSTSRVKLFRDVFHDMNTLMFPGENNARNIARSAMFGTFFGVALSPAIFNVRADDEIEAALDGTFKAFEVKKLEKLTRDTYALEILFKHKDMPFGLDPASFCLFKAKIEGKDVIRPYTPVSPSSQTGRAKFVIKKYPNALMGGKIASLKKGDKISIKGPIMKTKYIANQYEHVGLIAGGTGITPMNQLINNILLNPEDKTKITLVFANQSPDDILEYDRLLTYQKQHPERFRVIFTVDNPSSDWEFSNRRFHPCEKGFVTKEMLERNKFPKMSDKTRVFVCGPNPMIEAVAGPKTKDYKQGELAGVLKEYGYDSDHVFKF